MVRAFSRKWCGVLAWGFIVLTSSGAMAQQGGGGITGTARDASGAVLPGVTVEAASPALIEKVRSVTTDTAGRYSIIDVRPGIYSVTFTLAGFKSVKHEGVELTAGFTATINGDLEVGAVEETITVTGASPLVDATNTRQQTVLSLETLESLPTTRSIASVLTIAPGMAPPADTAGATGVRASGPGGALVHGKSGMKINFDGMRIQNMCGTGQSPGAQYNSIAVQEIAIESGGASAEGAASSVVINMVPKDGGNSFRGEFLGVWSGEALQSNNLDDELRSRGVTAANTIDQLIDVGGTFSGPISRDKVWFFAAHRYWGSKQQVAGFFFNQTQGTPFYTADLTRPGKRSDHAQSTTGRLTTQAGRHKFTLFADMQNNCECPNPNALSGNPALPPTGTISPEAWTEFQIEFPTGYYQATWTMPVTSRLLLQAGVGTAIFHWPNVPVAGTSADAISITDTALGLTYNADPIGDAIDIGDPRTSDRYTQRFSMTYATGSHSFKAGVQVEEGSRIFARTGANVLYVFNNRVPTSVVQYATPYSQTDKLLPDLGLYVQDQWAIKRLTLNVGLRYDYFRGVSPATSLPAGDFVPERSFAEVVTPRWSDFNPRLGATFDIFGTGKTAVKFSAGRYVNILGVGVTQQANPMVTSVNNANRTWTDANRNYVPDCDLKNLAGNGECGPILNSNFGKNNPGATVFRDEVTTGFGARPFTWDISAEVQHEVRQGLSVTAGYYQNWMGNIPVTHNMLTTPADYDDYCVTAPTAPQNGFTLPGGGGYQVCGLYDLQPSKVGQVQNEVVPLANYTDGEQGHCAPTVLPLESVPCGKAHFFSASLNGRFSQGGLYGGGIDTGTTSRDSCWVVNSPQQLLHCDKNISTASAFVSSSWKANLQIKLNGSLPLPADFNLSGVYINAAGPVILASYTATNAQIAPSLGRNLGTCGTQAVCTAVASGIPLIEPGTQYEDRRSQFDIRLSKGLQVNAVRIKLNLDLFNAFNANSILAINNTYGAQWRRPTSILNGRLIQLGGELTF